MSKLKVRTRFAKNIKLVRESNPDLADALQKVYDLSKDPKSEPLLLETEVDLKKAFPYKKEKSSDEETEETPEDEGVKEEDPEEESTETAEEEVMPPASDAEEEEPVDATEGTKKIVIDLLEELGLVESTQGIIKFVGDLQNKEIRKDVALIAVAVEELAESLAKKGSGPVLREIGPLNSESLQRTQQIEVLKKSLNDTKNPSAREAIQNEIARLEIQTVQGQKQS